MTNRIGFICLVAFALAACQTPEQSVDAFDPAQLPALLRKVTAYQLSHLRTTTELSDGGMEPVPNNGWVRSALFSGVMAAYDATQDPYYLEQAKSWARANDWKPGPKPRHADDLCAGQTYVALYLETNEEHMIQPIRANLDSIVAYPTPGPKVGWSKGKNWAWCDALFMAPPVFAMLSHATGDPSYLTTMDTLWWQTSEYLYDPEEHLYYRDSKYKPNPEGTEQREKNGEKVFWGRGNGWVLGGLTKVLEYMPQDYANRDKFVTQYREMAAKIMSLQHDDGLWRSSLYDPASFPDPETSASSFYCYALAWGLNNGILDRETYEPVVRKAWQGLVSSVNGEGKLGWVQSVGHDPRKVNREDTHEYAVGAFLHAGKEMMELLQTSTSDQAYQKTSYDLR